MMDLTANNEAQVDLPEDEFYRVYGELRNCLAREMSIDMMEGDDAAFLTTCRQALQRIGNAERHFHFAYGFLPLLERLHQARAEPVRDDGRVIYRVTFS